MNARSQPPEINPYAAPQVGDPVVHDADPSIGVWRDGDLLVVHKKATLPPICLRTGQPATHFRDHTLTWTYPIDWCTRTLVLKLPMGEAEYQAHRKRSLIGILALVLPLAWLFVAVWLPEGFREPLAFLFAATFLIGMFVSYLARRPDRRALRFVAARGEHLWLRGADAKFLRHLPPWPLGESPFRSR